MTEFDDKDDVALATPTDGDPDGDPPSGISGNKEVGAIAHLYRAEVYRSTVWRQRLDQTTNWAVISTGIGLSAAFASERASPFPIVLVGALCIMFLMLEARRYRFFYVWRFGRACWKLPSMCQCCAGRGLGSRSTGARPCQMTMSNRNTGSR